MGTATNQCDLAPDLNLLRRGSEHKFVISQQPLNVIKNDLIDHSSAKSSLHSSYHGDIEHIMGPPDGSSPSGSTPVEMGNLGEPESHLHIKSFFFDDGVRRIDFILVYNKATKSPSEKDVIFKACRKQFESNLRDEGLELEYAKDRSGLKFVKIHAPWDVLIRYAEIMKLKMPMKQIETSWRLVFDEEDPYSKGKFTAPFTRDKLYLFDVPPQKDRFFSTSQRSQIVDFILKRKNFAANANDASSFGINRYLLSHLLSKYIP